MIYVTLSDVTGYTPPVPPDGYRLTRISIEFEGVRAFDADGTTLEEAKAKAERQFSGCFRLTAHAALIEDPHADERCAQWGGRGVNFQAKWGNWR
jgi:hypothetical protein